MEFDRYLLQIQRCMTSTHNTLLSLKDSIADAENSKILSCKIKSTIEKWPTNYDFRKVYLYMICNCNLHALNNLSEDETIGHIIGTCIPYLSKYLVLHAIFTLDNVSFLQDLVTFGPHLLSADLLETCIVIADSDSVDTTIDLSIQLSKACFHKLVLCKDEDFHVQFKFFMYFKKLVNIILDIKPDVRSSAHELYRLAGKVAQSFLKICTFCMKDDLRKKGECWECFLLNCDSNVNDWPAPSSELCTHDELIWQCRDLILSTCVKNLSAVSVDVWLSWVEIDVTETMTMQQCVGEAAYECSENLNSVRSSGKKLDSLPSLLTILSQMQIKPWNEEDEVQKSSLSVIIENLADENRNKKVWLKGLLHHDEALESIDSISVIENYSNLLDEEDAVFLLNITVCKLRLLNDSSTSYLVDLLCKVMEHFSLESHVKILEKHLINHGDIQGLCFERLSSRLISVFNKMIDSQDDKNQLTCEALRLCILNSKAVVEEALNFALEGQRQSTMMSKFLLTLEAISRNLAREWINKKSETCAFEGSQIDTFPFFVSELVGTGVLDAEVFIKECAMPAILHALNTGHLNLVVMWITSLELTLKRKNVFLSQDFRWSPLLAFTGGLLERCLNTIPTFNIHNLDVRDAVLSLLKTLTGIKLHDMEQQWLSTQIANHPPIIYCYLKVFTNVPEAEELYIVENCHYKALKYCFSTLLQQIQTASCVLVEILPSLTMNEWNYLADYFKEGPLTKGDKIWGAFQVFRQSMLLITAASLSPDAALLSEQKICCLNYCVRSFGYIVKDHIVPSLSDSYHLTLLTEILQILSRCPSSVWDGSAIFLSSLLFDLFKSIPHNSAAANQLKFIFSKCPESETRSLIETKLSEVLVDCMNQ